jgi:multicomponent Na+:H+ antiporter subunit B
VRPGRTVVGALGLILIAAGLAWAVTGLHAFGGAESEYGRTVAHAAVPQRAATNSVVVIAFDYRGFDTLGEEFILFISVVGVTVLLRGLRSQQKRAERTESPGPRGSEATRYLGATLVGGLTVLGAYIVTHGHLTPGGGFQGGVILMAAVAAMFVGGHYVVLVGLRRSATLMEMSDAVGAAGFAIIGFGGLVGVGTFFANFIPKGKSGLLTGGMIPLANIAVGLEVAGALLMVLAELLDERLLSSRT